MAELTADIFKAYDVRGLYGEEMDGETNYAVGRAFARVLADLRGKPTSELRVGLGRDMRLSAPELAQRYREGLMAEGAHVVDAGMVGTEMLYWLVGSPSSSKRRMSWMPSSPESAIAPSRTSLAPVYCLGLCEAVTIAPPSSPREPTRK